MSSRTALMNDGTTSRDHVAPTIETRTFPAMSGTVEVQLLGRPEQEALDVETLFGECEQAMSRFLPWSELCALNAAAPRPFVVSPLLFGVVCDALNWARATEGIFDPTVIDVLNDIGYDRTFDLVRDAPRAARKIERRPRRWQSIVLDEEVRTVTLPDGVALDLGGIGKGYTVDRAIERLGPGANAIVNASGDLRAAGAGLHGTGWRVGVQNPFSPDEHLAILVVRDRAVATSGSARRQWHIGDTRYHHLIDTRTLNSSGSDLLTVTVVAATATEADVLAKVAFFLGSVQGPLMLERFGAEGLAVRLDGGIVKTAGIERYLHGADAAIPASQGPI